MADSEVRVRITAEDRASAAVDKVEGRFAKLGNFLASKFVFTLGDVTRAFTAITGALVSATNASASWEAGVKRLETATGRFGNKSEGISRSLLDQADALQKLTGVSNDATIGIQALLLELGVSSEQIEKATLASVNLSSALGISLESAARNVGKTVGGFAGELGEVIPELKTLGAEALKAGEGIDLLGDKFAGTAAANADTFQGAVTRVDAALVDLQKAFGGAITGSESSSDAMRGLAITIERLAGSIEQAQNPTNRWADAWARLSKTLVVEGNPLAKLVSTVLGLASSIGKAERETRKLTDAQGGAADATNDQAAAVERLTKAQARQLADQETLNLFLADAGIEVRDFNSEIARQENALEAARVAYAGVADGAERFAQVERQVADNIAEIRSEMQGQNQELDENADSFNAASGSIGNYTSSTNQATRAVRNLRIEQKRASDQAATIVAGGESGFGGTLTGSGSQLFPNSAIANTAIRDGRRIRVLPNGQRVRV